MTQTTRQGGWEGFIFCLRTLLLWVDVSGMSCRKEWKPPITLTSELLAWKCFLFFFFFLNSVELNTAKNGKCCRRGGGHTVRSWDSYLKIDHKGPEMGLWYFRKIHPWGFWVSLLGQASSAVSSALSGSLQDHVSCLTKHGKEGKKICDMLLRKQNDLICFRWDFCLLG